jgi:murein L,D-transpeptidase YcbB/YkuD
LEKRSGKELDPKDVTRKMLLSGDYRIRQDNGEGNSLGRLILRFPNNFAVYLHDTNNKSAFRREKRMVSHGCIRVEQPLDLAIFVLDKPEDEDIDKIRTAIGLPPLSEDFEQDTTDTAEIKMEIMHVKPTVPVMISYFTLYPDIHGKWQSHPDLYGYDKVILEKLATY